MITQLFRNNFQRFIPTTIKKSCYENLHLPSIRNLRFRQKKLLDEFTRAGNATVFMGLFYTRIFLFVPTFGQKSIFL